MNAPAPAAPRTAGAVRPRSLALLAVAVLAAHLLLLQGLPEALTPGGPAPDRARPLLTRALPPAAPAPAAENTGLAPAVPPRAPPKPRPPPRPRPDAAPAGPAPPVSPAGAAVAESPATSIPATEHPPPPAVDATAPAAPHPKNHGDANTGPVVVAGPARLNYSVHAQARGIPYTAQAELRWEHDGASYSAQLSVSAFLFGSRTQTSTGRLTPQGLAPTRFSDRSRSEQAAHFDREHHRISFSANTPDAPLLSGAQDRLSLFLQLGALIAGDPARHGPGTTLTVQAAGPRDAEPWLLTVEGDETLELAGQSLPTVKLHRRPRREYDTQVELWLGRGLEYLPVRIRITQANGDTLDQQLRAIEPLGPR